MYFQNFLPQFSTTATHNYFSTQFEKGQMFYETPQVNNTNSTSSNTNNSSGHGSQGHSQNGGHGGCGSDNKSSPNPNWISLPK